jgi:hypothetical protein
MSRFPCSRVLFDHFRPPPDARQFMVNLSWRSAERIICPEILICSPNESSIHPRSLLRMMASMCRFIWSHLRSAIGSCSNRWSLSLLSFNCIYKLDDEAVLRSTATIETGFHLELFIIHFNP